MVKIKRLAAVFLTAAVALGCLSGCGKKEAGSEEQPRGGYVQRSEELAERLGEWTVKQIFTAGEPEGGESLHLFLAKETESGTVFREWRREEEGSYSDVTRDWLAGMCLPCKLWEDVKLLRDGAGAQYLFANLLEGDCYRARLWRGEGSQTKEITPEKWTAKDETWGVYEFVTDVAALDNGRLAAKGSRSLDFINGEDGSLLSGEELQGLYGETLCADGDGVWLFGMDETGSVREIRRRDGGAPERTVPFPQGGRTGCFLAALPGGSLISAGADGVFRCEAGEADWKKLLDGSETDFSISSFWCVDMAAAESGTVYALFEQEGGKQRLVRYEYDPEAVREVTETLRLYTVYESSLLQNAAALYHREHPEVMIEIQYLYSYNDKYSSKKPDFDEIYQQLNTLLMGENAPDILVLDHLQADNLADKGLLADLGDVLEPLEEQGAVLKNITGAYVRAEGGRYAAPLQFSIPLAVGRDIGEKDMSTLENLAGFLSAKGESFLGEQTAGELVDKFYPYFCGEIVKDKAVDREALSGKLECLRQIAENCGIVERHDKDHNEGRCYNMWDLASRAKLAFAEAEGFRGSMFVLSICKYIGGEFAAFENSFQPMEQIGICTKTKYLNTARDFLRFALSETVQDTDYYQGFPVNAASLEKQLLSDRSEMTAVTGIETEGGGEELLEIGDYSKETADRLFRLCGSVEKPVAGDDKIREVLTEALGGYLAGEQSLEETVGRIEDGLKMYLAE